MRTTILTLSVIGFFAGIYLGLCNTAEIEEVITSSQFEYRLNTGQIIDDRDYPEDGFAVFEDGLKVGYYYEDNGYYILERIN